MTVRVMHVGLGPIGVGVLRQVDARRGFKTASAVDIDSAKIGRDVGSVCGLDHEVGVTVVGDIDTALADAEVDVAALCTASSLPGIMPQLEKVMEAGLPIVSTTEELSYPHFTNADLAGEIDYRARRAGVAVVGTGVNPGFAMDTLPIALTGVCERVDSIRVDRIQDASTRRLPFQRKIGAGLDIDAFRARVERKEIRHVGLTESIAMVAEAMGWKLDRITDVVEPWIADQPVASDKVSVEAGQAAGLVQDGIGYRNDKPVVHLHMEAYLGAPETYDRVRIEGSPDLDTRIEGIHGDVATVSMTVNTLRAVLDAKPGLRTMLDLPGTVRGRWGPA